MEASGRDEEAFVHYRNAAGLDPGLADPLSQALGRYGQRQPARAQAGMQRLNRYIGTFLTNHASARMGVYPGLASAPYHDVGMLPGALALERGHAAIRNEVEALAATEFQAEAEGLMERGSWDVFLFYERSRKHEEHCARCPTITRIIEASNTVRTQAGLLYVSKLSPGTHCGLKVGGETVEGTEALRLIVSVHQTHFSPLVDLPTGGKDLVFYYRQYERLMAHWRAVLPADRFLELRYEELIANPEPITRRLIAFCGLPWDDACLHPERNQRVVKTASKWQARQPVYRSSVDRWRRYEPWLGELRELLPPAIAAPAAAGQ